MKRGNGFADDGPPSKYRRSDDPSKLLRVLIPSRAAGPIIGKGGETIKDLRAQVLYHTSHVFIVETSRRASI